jgi:hypothetical protein
MRRSKPGTFTSCIALAFCLSACSAPALYRPYADTGSYGYSEVNVAKNRYEVFFHGPSDIDDAAAKNFAIVRAAELGRQNGFAYFRLANSRVRRETYREVLEPELFPRNQWTGESMSREERERRAWEDSRRRRQRVVTLKPEPVVQLTVQYRNEDCEDCLEVAAKVSEALEQGILKAPAQKP